MCRPARPGIRGAWGARSEEYCAACRGVFGEAWCCRLDDAEIRRAIASARRPRGLPLPDKPSIAVLAFTNMSGEVDQEYFSDGISEDIITELSRSRSLFVIARNSSFTYKGHAVDVKQVARELGVRYVVEGSVRRSGSRIRVIAQLIDAETGNHIWAERYDREFERCICCPGRDHHCSDNGNSTCGNGCGTTAHPPQAAGEPRRMGGISARSVAHGQGQSWPS